MSAPPQHGQMRVADLVTLAQSSTPAELTIALGSARGVLVGPKEDGADDLHYVTHLSTRAARRVSTADFHAHEVFLVRISPGGSQTRSIGRDPSNDLVLEGDSISKRHALLVLDDGVLKIEDLGSRNGTLVRGALVLPKTRVSIEPGDTVQLGSRGLKYYDLPRFVRTLRQLVSR